MDILYDNVPDNPRFTNETTNSILVGYLIVSFLGYTIGSFGNLWYYIVIIWSVSLHQKPFYQLMSLVTLCDGILNFLFFPIKALMIFSFSAFDIKLISDVACFWIGSIYVTLYSSSNLLQLYITIYRGCAFFWPIWFRQISKLRPRLIVYLGICCSIFISITIHYVCSTTIFLFNIDPLWGDCYGRGTTTGARIFRRVLFIFIPIFLSLAVYGVLSIRVILIIRGCPKMRSWQTQPVNEGDMDLHNEAATPTSSGDSGLNVTSQLRPTVSLMLRMLFCCVAVVPFWWDIGEARLGDSDISGLWTNFLFHFSYCINPIFYSIFDESLKVESKHLFRRLRNVH